MYTFPKYLPNMSRSWIECLRTVLHTSDGGGYTGTGYALLVHSVRKTDKIKNTSFACHIMSIYDRGISYQISMYIPLKKSLTVSLVIPLYCVLWIFRSGPTDLLVSAKLTYICNNTCSLTCYITKYLIIFPAQIFAYLNSMTVKGAFTVICVIKEKKENWDYVI